MSSVMAAVRVMANAAIPSATESRSPLALRVAAPAAPANGANAAKRPLVRM